MENEEIVIYDKHIPPCHNRMKVKGYLRLVYCAKFSCNLHRNQYCEFGNRVTRIICKD